MQRIVKIVKIKLDISRTESHMVKILSPFDSTHQITYMDHQKTAFGLKSVLTNLDLTTLTTTISLTERDTLEILSPLNSTHKITYNYTLR